MTARTGSLVTVADAQYAPLHQANFSSLETVSAVAFSPFSRAAFSSLVSVSPVAYYPFTQSRAGAWSRTFNTGFLPDLETPMTTVQVLQNTATTISIFMRDGSTGLGLPGIASSAFIVKLKKSNQVAFSTITPSVTDTGLGWYDLAITGAHTDTAGKAPLEVAATGALTRDDVVLDVWAVNVFTDAVHAGLSALPNAAAGANTGLPVVGTQIPNATAGANTGLPVVGTQIPNATAGANGGLPLVGTQVPNATAGASGGLPLVGSQIPNANAGTSEGVALYKQVENIAVTGAALNKTATSRTITTGVGTGGVGNTVGVDQVYDNVADSAGTLDFYYEFTVASITSGVGVGVRWTGYLVGIINALGAYVFNWNTVAWDQLGSVAGIAGAVNGVEDWELTNDHTGTGGNLGLVRIRFQGTGLTSATLKTDQILLGYVVTPATATDVAASTTTLAGDITTATTTLAGDISTSQTAVTTAISATQTALAGDITTSQGVVTAAISAAQTAIIAAIPSAASIRDAVLDAARSGHIVLGSIGEGIALATSLLQGNFFIDNVDNSSPNGPTAQRLRCWLSAAAMAGLTPGGIGEGEFATFAVTTTYSGVNKIVTHKVVQQ